MTTLEKIRAEIEKHTDGNNHCDEYLDGYNNGMKDALEILDKYAEQEPKYCDRNICIKNEYNGIECDECIVNKAEQEPCDDAVSRQAVLQAVSEGCFELRGVYGRCEELINALPSVRPQEPQESDEISERNMKMWQDIFEEEKRRAE